MSFTLHHMRSYTPRLAAYGVFVVLSVFFTMATALSVADFIQLLFPPEQESLSVHSANASLLSQALNQLYLSPTGVGLFLLPPFWALCAKEHVQLYIVGADGAGAEPCGSRHP